MTLCFGEEYQTDVRYEKRVTKYSTLCPMFYNHSLEMRCYLIISIKDPIKCKIGGLPTKIGISRGWA